MTPAARMTQAAYRGMAQRKAFEDGDQAGREGLPHKACPHKSPQSGARGAWRAGWDAAPKPDAWVDLLPDAGPLDVPTARRVAAAVVLQAVEGLTEGRPRFQAKTRPENRANRTREWQRRKVAALLWFASKTATRWIENLGYDQEAMLSRLKWTEHARWVLKDDSFRRLLTMEERVYLRKGIDVMEVVC